MELFVAEGFYRVELGGFHGGPDAEDEADADADADADDGGPEGHAAGPFQAETHQQNETIYKNERNYSTQACQGHRFEQKLPDDVLAFCADGFADADFTGTFGDADEHDVHHADAADEQADGTENDRGDGHFADDVVEFLDLLSGGGDGEVVLAVIGNVAAAAKDFGDLVHHLVEHIRLCLHAEVQLGGRRKCLAKCAERNQDTAVFIAHAETAFGLFHHADHLKTGAVNRNVFADGIAFGEKNRGDIFAEHDHFFLVQVVAFGDEAAREGGGVSVDEAEIGLDAAEIDRVDFAGFRADGVRDIPITGDERGDVLDAGAAFLEDALIVKCQGLALAFFEGRRPAVAALIPLGDESGIRAELLHVFLNLRVEAGDESSDEHDDTDAENDAKNREGAAQFVAAKRIHRLPEIFAVGLRHTRLAFRSKSFNRIEFRSPHGREDAEKKSHGRGEDQRKNDGGERGFHGERENCFHQVDSEIRSDDTDEAATGGEDGGLGEELQKDVHFSRAERAAQTDFAGALGDAGQHDVHDNDAADDEKNADERHGHEGEITGEVVPESHDGIGAEDGEIVGSFVVEMAPGAEKHAGLVLTGGHHFGVWR